MPVIPVAVARPSSNENAIGCVYSCRRGFADNFMIAGDRPGKGDANRPHTDSDSPVEAVWANSALYDYVRYFAEQSYWKTTAGNSQEARPTVNQEKE